MEAPTSERAWELVKTCPIDASFHQVYKRCTAKCCRASRGHGPYWTARWFDSSGKVREKHIGSDEKLEMYKAAHEVARRELAELENYPTVKKLRSLERLAYARGRTPQGVVTVPIVDLSSGPGPIVDLPRASGDQG